MAPSLPDLGARAFHDKIHHRALTLLTWIAYNAAVRKRASNSPRPAARARYLETLGLILIALLIIAVTLARFAKSLPWRAR